MYWKQNSIPSQQAFAENTDPVVNEEGLDMDLNEDVEQISLDQDELLETYIVDMVSHMLDEERKAYLDSEDFQNLVEAGVAGHKSITRLNKQDDLSRRIMLGALNAAEKAGDATWELLRKNRVKERQLLNTIYKKYANRVKRDAMLAQKRLIKLNPQVFNTLRAIR